MLYHDTDVKVLSLPVSEDLTLFSSPRPARCISGTWSACCLYKRHVSARPDREVEKLKHNLTPVKHWTPAQRLIEVHVFSCSSDRRAGDEDQ